MNKVEWCWYKIEPRRGAHAHGPYDTREEAVDSARDYHLGDGKITIALGYPCYAEPKNWIPNDMDELLERMDQFASDNGFPSDDPIFDVPKENRTAAEKDLRDRLESWAQKWISTSGTWVMHGTEEVEISTDPTPGSEEG